MPSEHQKKRAAKKKEMAKVKRKILDIKTSLKLIKPNVCL